MADTEFTLDWPHGWTTRDGRKVRILCKDAKSTCPIAGLVTVSGDIETHHAWFASGKHAIASDDLDLINTPAPKRTVWVNWWHMAGSVYMQGGFGSRELADQGAGTTSKVRSGLNSADTRFACTELEIPEAGTGLDSASPQSIEGR